MIASRADTKYVLTDCYLFIYAFFYLPLADFQCGDRDHL